MALAASAVILTSCGVGGFGGLGTTGTTSTNQTSGSATGNILGSILGAATNGQTVGNVLQSVLGLDKVTQQSLVGTWTYVQPGCAFTSEQLLAQAGGEVVATEIKQKLTPIYQKVGINGSNTKVQFNSDGTYTATIAGKQLSGKWTFDESNYKITMQGLLLNMNCYAKKNSNGIALLFEASKLLTVMQTLSAMSGNSSLQTVSDLSKNYKGLRIGFDMK